MLGLLKKVYEEEFSTHVVIMMHNHRSFSTAWNESFSSSMPARPTSDALFLTVW